MGAWSTPGVGVRGGSEGSAVHDQYRCAPWQCVILGAGVIAAGSLAWTWVRSSRGMEGRSAELDRSVRGSGSFADPPHGMEHGASAARGCTACEAKRHRDFSHPVLAKVTVAARSYLAAAADRGPEPEDVEELRALVLLTGEGDGGDAAVYAVRAAGEWARSAIQQTVVRGTLEVLLDASSDPRERVSRNARELLQNLSGAM